MVSLNKIINLVVVIIMEIAVVLTEEQIILININRKMLKLYHQKGYSNRKNRKILKI